MKTNRVQVGKITKFWICATRVSKSCHHWRWYCSCGNWRLRLSVLYCHESKSVVNGWKRDFVGRELTNHCPATHVINYEVRLVAFLKGKSTPFEITYVDTNSDAYVRPHSKKINERGVPKSELGTVDNTHHSVNSVDISTLQIPNVAVWEPNTKFWKHLTATFKSWRLTNS